MLQAYEVTVYGARVYSLRFARLARALRFASASRRDHRAVVVRVLPL